MWDLDVNLGLMQKMDPEDVSQQAPAMKYKFSANVLCN